MADFLEFPQSTIVIAATLPTLPHCIGVFSVVHLMARKLDLEGMPKDALPRPMHPGMTAGPISCR